jgi:hypothetical protein
MNKTELLEELEDERQELLEMIGDLPEETLLQPGVIGDWAIKDILAHLTYWEGQTVTLLFQVQQGIMKPTTAHFSGETVDELNKRWHESGKDRPLDVIWKDWLGVRKQTIRRAGELNENDLTNPQRFPWLKGVPLWQWILNDTVEHEGEHASQIREWLDQHDEQAGSDLPKNNGHDKR